LRPVVRIQFRSGLKAESQVGTITVTDETGATVAGTQTYRDAGKGSVSHFLFNEDLNPGRPYTVTLSNLTDTNDEQQDGFNFTFTPRPKAKSSNSIDRFADVAGWAVNIASGTNFNNPTTGALVNTAVPTDTEAPVIGGTSRRVAYNWTNIANQVRPNDNAFLMFRYPFADRLNYRFNPEGATVEYWIFGDGSNSRFYPCVEWEGPAQGNMFTPAVKIDLIG